MKLNAPIEPISLDIARHHQIDISVKRDDLIDDKVSGNKLYKLKLNIEDAIAKNHSTILTFGGAYSNHIIATAKYCALNKLVSIGIIRGERMEPLNATLEAAEKFGMRLVFISRADYRKKTELDFLEHINSTYDSPYIVPEGGGNKLGIMGASEMLNPACAKYDFIVTAMGTGTTFAGLVYATSDTQKVIGLPIHKHDKLLEDIVAIDPEFASINSNNYKVVNGYHFGGYAKWTDELIEFCRIFHQETSIKLDPIYTAKAMYGLLDLIKQGTFNPNSKILFIHTGGLQGIAGIEKQLGESLY